MLTLIFLNVPENKFRHYIIYFFEIHLEGSEKVQVDPSFSIPVCLLGLDYRVIALLENLL